MRVTDSSPVQMAAPPEKPAYSTLDRIVYAVISSVGSLGNKTFKAKLVNNLLPSHTLTTSTYTAQLKAYVDKTLSANDVKSIFTAAKILQDRVRKGGREETREVEKEQYQHLLNKLPPDYQGILETRSSLKKVLASKDKQTIENLSRAIFESWSQESDPGKSSEWQELYIMMLPRLSLKEYGDFLIPFFVKTLQKNDLEESTKALRIANSLLKIDPFPKGSIDNAYYYEAIELQWERLRDQVNKKSVEQEAR